MAKIFEKAEAMRNTADRLHSKCMVLQDYINAGASCEEVSAAYSNVAFEFGVLSQVCKDLKGECWNGAYSYNIEFDI